MATSNYGFYTVEQDPIHPFRLITRTHQGGTEAMKALTSNRRIAFMSANKDSAEKMKTRMTEAMTVVIR